MPVQEKNGKRNEQLTAGVLVWWLVDLNKDRGVDDVALEITSAGVLQSRWMPEWVRYSGYAYAG